LLGFDAGHTYAHLDQTSAEQLLAALRLPERARMMLLHAYACPPGVAAAKLGATMLAELERLWPETRSLHQLDRYCHVGTDAAGFPVGGHATTPGVHTTVPGLTLAGDWVATPFPSALMERAAATGVGAANAILAAHGYYTEPVWSVPPRGILAGRWTAAMRRGSPQRAGTR